jgi:hypothetical protein
VAEVLALSLLGQRRLSSRGGLEGVVASNRRLESTWIFHYHPAKLQCRVKRS